MQYILCIVYDKFPQDFSSTSLHFSNIFHLIPSRSDIEKPNPEKQVKVNIINFPQKGQQNPIHIKIISF